MVFFEICFVNFHNNFVFGRKIKAPVILNRNDAKNTAKALTFPINIDAKKTSAVVPKLAPIIKGKAFLKFIILETAKGTNRLIVILEEKTIAVKKTPRK